ncbi:hypothetical protein PTKIN_Ptkin02bG0053500 [Pterospermum kingtungense]
MCGRRKQAEETGMHTIQDCVWAKEVWSLFPGKDQWLRSHDTAAAHWISRVLETMDKALVEEGLSLLWAIWNWRNKEVMNREKVTAQFVFEKKAPMRDFYKINFDGAFSKEEVIGGIGVVARDVDSLVTGALHLAIWNMRDVASVEATATAIAAKFAKDLGLSKVIFEGDALAIINAINSIASYLSTIGNIIKETRAIGRSFRVCQFVYVRRQANVAAHTLAKRAIQVRNLCT